MKVTQYVTNANVSMKPFAVLPMGGKMNGAKTVWVDETPQKGAFLGFGAALTASSCYLLDQMDAPQRKAFLRDVYGRDGLHLSVGRVSVGSSDYSPYVYSYDDVPDDTDLSHFSVERDEAFVIPMIREVQRVNPDLFLFASPWSPPGWMKTGGSLGGGYFRRKYLDLYAAYYIRFLKAYAEHGIFIQALTPQNEPEAEQAGRMTACVWHPELEAEFVLLLKQKLKEQGLDTRIWLYDHNFQGVPRVLWCLEQYPELASALDGIAFHYYDGNVEKLDEIGAHYPDMTYHFTEGGPRLYDHYDSDWCKWGTMINSALRHGCRSFTGWNLLLDETGGPNIGPFFCGGLATYHTDTKELTYSGQYKAFRQYSHFIQPGAMVYDAKVLYDGLNMFGYHRESLPATLSVSAVKNPDGSTVVHLVNAGGAKQQVQLQAGGRWWYAECLPDSVNTLVMHP